MAQMQSTQAVAPDVGIDHIQAIEVPEALPETFIVSYEAVTAEVSYLAMIPQETAVGQVKTVYTIHSQIESKPRLMDWETPLGYIDRHIDPGLCSLADEGYLRSI